MQGLGYVGAAMATAVALASDEKGNRLVRCKYCNAEGFHWAKFDKKWRLFKWVVVENETCGKIHDCRSDVEQPNPFNEEYWEAEPIPPECDNCDDYGCFHCNGDYSPT